MDHDLIEVGKFGRAHGTRGELRLWCYNPESPLFENGKLKAQACAEDGSLQDVEITSLRWADRFAIVKIKGVNHRSDAEAFINQRLLVSRDAFAPLEDDELYLIDTVGWPVWIEHEGRYYEVGSVQGYLDTGAYDLMRVDLVGGKSWLVPVLDHCILGMDPSVERIVLAPLDEWGVEGEELPEYKQVADDLIDTEEE